MLDLFEEFGAIIDALNARGVPYALCGGLAMAAYGFTRATEDIDLFLLPENYAAAKEAVAPLGYTFEAHAMSFASGAMQIRRLTKIDPSDGDVLSLDFLLATAASQDVWTTRREARLGDRRIWVVSREGLIALKRFRSSKLDLADIEHLERNE